MEPEGISVDGRGENKVFWPKYLPLGCHAVTHFFLHFHAITLMRKRFSRHHTHQKDLSRITHEGRLTQSRIYLFIFTQSLKKMTFHAITQTYGGPSFKNNSRIRRMKHASHPYLKCTHRPCTFLFQPFRLHCRWLTTKGGSKKLPETEPQFLLDSFFQKMRKMCGVGALIPSKGKSLEKLLRYRQRLA